MEKTNSSLAKIFNLTKKYTILEIVLDIVLVTGILNFSEAIIRIVGGSMILNNTLTIGTLTAILTYFFRIWDTAESIMEFPKKYKTKVVSAKNSQNCSTLRKNVAPTSSRKNHSTNFRSSKWKTFTFLFLTKKYLKD
ncbi:MAG: hypothetical protein ABIM21_03100 [candidate division WOR-3 bacterium]